MSYEKGVFSAVLELFEEKRTNSRLENQKRTQKIYAQIPKIAEIDRELKNISIDAVRESFTAKDPKKLMKQYKKKSLELQAVKEELLAEQGYSFGYLKERFDCKHCEDKGYNGINMCNCFKKALRKESYSRSNLGAFLNEQTFKNFNFDYYLEQKNNKYGVSSKENIEKIFDFSKKYAEKFSLGSGNLLLMGKTGLGKTFLSTAMAKVIIDKGNWVIYDTAQNILLKIEKNRFGKESNENEISRFFDCDLLIIDDLGAEFKTAFSESALYNIINTRLVAKRPMIISTNYDNNELNDIYSERIISRLVGEFVTLFFFGEDIRAKK